MKTLFRIEDYIVKVEKGIVVFLIAAMVLLSFMQVLLRIIFHSGIVWLDPLLRHCVLWAGFTGAALAARYSKHFALDLCSRFAPVKMRRHLEIFVALCTSAAAGFLFYAACRFIADEASSGAVAFYINHFAVKGCFAEFIIPVTFALVIFHCLLGIFRPEDPAEENSMEAASCAEGEIMTVNENRKEEAE
ncbi:MAG: TRAP transporter small permease [Elusimicrobiales bacterium]|nr:TRAP transporter small permease [Elusimicrobiales bacterium]